MGTAASVAGDIEVSDPEDRAMRKKQHMSDQISALDGGDERALVHARATLVGVCPELHAVFFVSVGDRRRCLLGLHIGMHAKWGMQRNVCPGLICATMRLKLAIAAHRSARWLGSWANTCPAF